MKKSKWITALIVIMAVVVIVSMSSTAISNVKGWFSKPDGSSSPSAQVQVIDLNI